MLIFPGNTHGTHSYLSYQEGARKGSCATRQNFFPVFVLANMLPSIFTPDYFLGGNRGFSWTAGWKKIPFWTVGETLPGEGWSVKNNPYFALYKSFSGRMWPCWVGQCRGTWGNSFTNLIPKISPLQRRAASPWILFQLHLCVRM